MLGCTLPSPYHVTVSPIDTKTETVNVAPSGSNGVEAITMVTKNPTPKQVVFAPKPNGRTQQKSVLDKTGQEVWKTGEF